MTAHWLWPQWTMVALYGVGLLGAAIKDGEPKKLERHSIGGTMFRVALGSWILWCGGFFQ